MTIGNSKARADRLVHEALAERRARREHLARAAGIFRRRLASPGGLALCFGAGAVTGLRLGRRTGAAGNGRTGHQPGDDREEQGFFGRMLDNPLGSIALRLAAAAIIRSILAPGVHGEAEAVAAGTAGANTGEMAGDAASY